MGLLVNGVLISNSISKAVIKRLTKVGLGDPGIELLLHHLVELDEFEEKLSAFDGVLRVPSPVRKFF